MKAIRLHHMNGSQSLVTCKSDRCSARTPSNTSPRVGHLHIHVDGLSWLWANFNSNPVDVDFIPTGQHKIRLELVNAIHQPVPGQSKTVTFTIPESASQWRSSRFSNKPIAASAERRELTWEITDRSL
jgi:hypothetical protein